MKIEYEIPKNFFQYYDYVQYITAQKKKIKKKPMAKVRRLSIFIMEWVILCSTLFLALCKLLFMVTKEPGFLEVTKSILQIVIIILLIVYFYMMLLYWKTKKGNKGTIIITKDGVTDKTEDCSLTVPYNQIDFIHFFDELGTIVLKESNICIYFYTKKKREMIKEIEKNNKNVLVIQQVSNRKEV